jgi:O-acetyl-ADP-ribose deacetylase (regulator of RNase III)
MSLIYKRGNLLDAKVDALVNAVNAVGVMGKGIALQFKYAFPENYIAYKKASERNEIAVGKVLVVPVNDLNGVKFIINFPTKQHWRNPSKLQWVKDGLKDLSEQIDKYNIKSIALPALGCGNGGLDWVVVKPVIEQYLSDLDIDVLVYEPSPFVIEIQKKKSLY